MSVLISVSAWLLALGCFAFGVFAATRVADKREAKPFEAARRDPLRAINALRDGRMP